mmetsp:Transcript_15828/g.41930  ORF Transcript_15828/g.41930 Transcript_15828/m.41930 type:complete len:229 (-) Transcript_15828:582-1268(-)
MTSGGPIMTSKPSRLKFSMRIPSCRMPRALTLKESALLPGSTRMARLVMVSFSRRFLMCVLVLQRVSFSCPEKGEELIPNSITTVGSSTMMGGRAMGFAGSTTVSPIVTSSMPEKAQMSPAATSSTTLLSLLWKSQSLLTFARLTSPSGPNMKPSSWPTTRLPEMTRPMEMRPMKGSKSRFETSICRGAWASTLGLGHSSRIWSRSGDRSFSSESGPSKEATPRKPEA